MTDPNIAQAPWEVKLHAFRRTQDGIVVSFVIHPQECPRALALDDLGTRYGMALARIDDEPAPGAPQAPAGKPVAPKPSRPFHTLPASQQAGIACADVAFQKYIGGFFGPVPGGELTGPAAAAVAAERLRRRLNITSRSELDKIEGAAVGWQNLYAAFEQWAGRVPVPR